jgi:membrane-associated HD superfamily phosphohydrolase
VKEERKELKTNEWYFFIKSLELICQVISIFWIFSMNFFDYLKYPDELIVMISVTFFVLILLTVAELQYKTWQAVAVLASLQVVNSMLLIFSVWHLGRCKNLQSKELDRPVMKKMYVRLIIIPSLRRVIIREL